MVQDKTVERFGTPLNILQLIMPLHIMTFLLLPARKKSIRNMRYWIKSVNSTVNLSGLFLLSTMSRQCTRPYKKAAGFLPRYVGTVFWFMVKRGRKLDLNQRHLANVINPIGYITSNWRISF